MSFDMLVEGFTECRIRVPSFRGPIKGVMEPPFDGLFSPLSGRRLRTGEGRLESGPGGRREGDPGWCNRGVFAWCNRGA